MMHTLDIRKYLIEISFFLSLILLGLFPFWKSLGVVPNFLSIVVYLWTLYRPDLMSRRMFILLGICRDAVMAYPLGIGILELVIISMIAKLFRRYVLERGFWVVFSGFILFTVIDNFLLWGILSWTKNQVLPTSGAIRPILVNILIYPMMSLVSLKIQHIIDTSGRKVFR